jgi:tungstate transport system ATP-binding protein
MTLLEARDLSVERGGRVVSSAQHLTLEPGKTLALLGPNGSGKSSLLLALASLLPARGELLFRGLPISDPLAYRRRIGVVLQRPILLDRTVLENASLGLELRGRGRRETLERARAALARLGIAGLAGRRVRGLSGGEAQRVSIARAIAPGPDLLFLDEPFGALDGPTRERLIADLARVLRDQGTASVLVTHDRDEALSLGDQVGIVMRGRVRQLDRADVVFATPADPEIADFIGVENILPAHVARVSDDITELRVGDEVVEATAVPPPGETFPLLCIPADDVVLSRGEISSSARNQFRARVIRLEPIGRRTRVVLDCGFSLVAHVTRRSALELGLAEDESVVASFKATVPHLLPRHRRN